MAGSVGAGNPFYSCRKCRSPLAFRDDLLSKKYLAKSGGAFMFTNALNIVLGQVGDKQLITGRFAIAPIFCSKCGEELGWKYLRAYEASEKHKEGRFIIEKAKVLKEY